METHSPPAELAPPFDSFDSTPGARFQKIAPATGKLAPADEAAVSAWLAAINETDPAEIARVVECCRTDPRALRYVLGELEAARLKSGGKFER